MYSNFQDLKRKENVWNISGSAVLVPVIYFVNMAVKYPDILLKYHTVSHIGQLWKQLTAVQIDVCSLVVTSSGRGEYYGRKGGSEVIKQAQDSSRSSLIVPNPKSTASCF